METKLKIGGLKPIMYRLDNERLEVLKNYIKTENIKYQLLPSHIHRRNTAEKVIVNFKDHFIAGLASIYLKILMYLWCRLLQHKCLALNVSRQSRINPKLSAYAQLEGQYNYSAHPISPPDIFKYWSIK